MAVLAIFVGALLLRTLGQRSMWYDEAYTYCFVATTWHDFRAIVGQLDIGISFYYICLRLWSDLVGLSRFDLRLFSFFFALASVGAVYLLGRQVFSHRVGLVAAALLLLNSFWFQEAQTARAYSMATFLGLVASIAFVRMLREKSGYRLSLVYVIIMAFLIASQFAIAAGIFAGHLGSFVVFRGRAISPYRAILVGVTVSILLGIGAYIISSVGSTLVHTPAEVSVTSVWHNISYLLGRKIAPIALSCMAIAGLINGFRRDPNVAAVAIWAIVPILLIIALAIDDSAALGARYMMGALGPFLILVAYGITQWTSRKVVALSIVLAVGAEIVGLVAYFDETWQDFGNKMNQMASDVRPGDVVVFSPPYLAVRVDVGLHDAHLRLADGVRTVPASLPDAWRTVDQRLTEADLMHIPSLQGHHLWIVRMQASETSNQPCESEDARSVLPPGSIVSTLCLR